MRAQLSTHDYEQLSAYLDGQLAPGERNRLEANLKTRPELQTALEDLRQTRALLRMAPRKRAPRNFTLTPAMVGQMPPARKEKRGWGGFNLFPVLSFASAMAAVLLVVVILFDLGASRTAMEAAPSVAAIPQSQLMSTRAAAPAAPAAGGGQTGPGIAAATQAPASNDTGQAGGAQPSTGQEVNPEPPAVAKAAPSDNGGIPGGPMNWFGATGRGGAGGMGYGTDPYSQVQQQYGVGGSLDGSLSVPPQVVQSMPPSQGQMSAQAAPQPAQPNPQISGTGPIMGVPSRDQAGKVIESQSLMGHPKEVTTVVPTEPVLPTPYLSSQPYPAVVPEQEAIRPWYARTVAGLPALRLIEGGLLAVLIATGISAFFLWRRRV